MSPHPIVYRATPDKSGLLVFVVNGGDSGQAIRGQQPDLRTADVRTATGMRVGERTRGGATRDTNIVNRKR